MSMEYVIITTYDWTDDADVFKVKSLREGKRILRTLFSDCCKEKFDRRQTFIRKNKYAQVVNGINTTTFRLAKIEKEDDTIETSKRT